MSDNQACGIPKDNKMEMGCDAACDCTPQEEQSEPGQKGSSSPSPPGSANVSQPGKKPVVRDLMTRKFARELFAEFLGTGMIVGFGTGAVMSAIFSDALVGLFQIAFVWIIAVTLAIATTGPISGAHLNPAISIAFAILRPCNGFGWVKVFPYVVAQTCGAIFFSWTNLVMYAPLITQFEAVNGIVRGEPESVASAKAFGEYYL